MFTSEESSPHRRRSEQSEAAGVYQRPTWNRFLRLIYRDRKAARRSIDRILEWPIERVVIGHGDVVTKDAHAAVRESFTWMK